MQRSTSTMSWSLLPMDGSGLHLSTSDGCVMKTRSCVFSLLEGKLTNYSNDKSSCIWQNLSVTLAVIVLATRRLWGHSRSGKLKSPPSKK
jgi:hypothetical protein